MNRQVFALAAVLALIGCDNVSEEDQLENAIREELTKQGEVRQVEMTKQGEDKMSGFVMIRENSGREGRLACTAERDAETSTTFNWSCSPAIDDKVLQEMEDTIRKELSARAPVIEVEMQRGEDDNNMSGFALLGEEGGEQARIPCRAVRDAQNIGSFNWSCGEEAENEEATPNAQ